MKKIAITGGVCCGKSTVLNHLAGKGFKVFNCDEAALDIAKTEEADDMLYQFETSILKIDYNYNPRPYSQLYRFAQMRVYPELAKMHSHLLQERLAEMIQASDATFVEAPIVFELDYDLLFGEIWVVKCDPETQIKRLTERYHGDEPLARADIYSYLALQNCLTRIDFEIDTDQSPKRVFADIDLKLEQAGLLSTIA